MCACFNFKLSFLQYCEKVRWRLSNRRPRGTSLWQNRIDWSFSLEHLQKSMPIPQIARVCLLYSAANIKSEFQQLQLQLVAPPTPPLSMAFFFAWLSVRLALEPKAKLMQSNWKRLYKLQLPLSHLPGDPLFLEHCQTQFSSQAQSCLLEVILGLRAGSAAWLSS